MNMLTEKKHCILCGLLFFPEDFAGHDICIFCADRIDGDNPYSPFPTPLDLISDKYEKN